MCCLLAVMAIFGPRLAFILTWIFTNRVAIAFHHGFLVPLLGLIFLPWTSLMYVFAYAAGRGVTGIGWLFVALGLAADIAAYSSGAYQRGRRSTTA
jgi:hypothetical protein